ncbi:putative RNA-directed DNA polymerase [Helianthus annuus]|nr:putative RNA-directed DNA polymerase [Helianthus annuus]
MATSVTTLSTHTHFPIQLTSDNFTAWRKQVLSTLTGLELEQFEDGRTEPPPKTLDGKTNPTYRLWFRQDQILLGALLGSCSATILPVVSSADTSLELFKRLTESFAGVSRSRIISLHSKLATTTKGSKPVADYLREMKAIADELPFAQKPVDDDDLIVHVITDLGDDYKQVTAAVKIRDNPISFSDLFEKLVDHERTMLEEKPPALISTVNRTQRQQGRASYNRSNYFARDGPTEARNSFRPNSFGPRPNRCQQHNNNSSHRTNRNNYFCQHTSHLHKIKLFGCLCFPRLRLYASSKLHPRSINCIFLGYFTSKSAYKCYDPVSHRLYHSRHVEFVEHVFPFKQPSMTMTTLPSVTTFLSTPSPNLPNISSPHIQPTPSDLPTPITPPPSHPPHVPSTTNQ